MDEDTKREIQDLKEGRLDPVGTFVLALTPATTTTVTSRPCSSNSTVIPIPYDADAATLGVPRVVPGKGQFVVHHAASAATRTYRYAVLSPRSR